MSKEAFKQFVKGHPELLQKVNSGEMTWQKYYEIYDMYGEDNTVWQQYMKPLASTNSTTKKDASLQELVNMVKKVDLETVRKGINGLQKAIGIVQDLGLGSKTSTTPQKEYEPRPMYKYFED